MRDIAVILLVAFVARTHAQEVAANRAGDAQDLIGMFADKLFDRLIQKTSLLHSDIDSTMLGKPAAAARTLANAATAPGLSYAAAPIQFASHSGMPVHVRGVAMRRPVLAHAASLQFVKGTEETNVPEVKLSRSKTGENGVATFIFDQPSIFEGESPGDVTGLYMVDDEGELRTVDVQARFINGKPAGIVAKYTMKGDEEWDRFMRFMERYAEEKDLGFQKTR